MKQTYLYPLFLLSLLGFIWGSGYTLARFAITEGVSPLGYAMWQTFGPVLVLSCIKIIRNMRFCLNRHHVITGLIGIAIPNTNMYYAARHIPAGLLAVLVNTVPIFTYCLALGFRFEKFQMLRLLAICFGIIGIAAILEPSLNTEAFRNSWLLILITPLSFACTALYINHQCQNEDNLNLAWGMLLVAGICLLPITLFSDAGYLLSWPLHLRDYAILIEIGLSTLGYIVFFELLKVSSPVYYSLVGGIVSITGLFWGKLILGERLHLQHAFGTFIVITAIILLTHTTARKTHD